MIMSLYIVMPLSVLVAVFSAFSDEPFWTLGAAAVAVGTGIVIERVER